ncbi:MAG: sodium:glutamate symporter [Lentisphaerae bacterium]|nr:sodium:glutamate symporter [Lentisphaerota bacterium]
MHPDKWSKVFLLKFQGEITIMVAVEVFCFLSLLLFFGKLIRMALPILQRLYLPSSVIGGAVGLLILTLFGEYLPAGVISGMGKLPGFLINVIFAALFLGTVTPKLGQIFKMALPQLCMGQLLAWGQYAIGLGLAGFILAPLFGVHPAFGNLLEIGFEGGHGTVGGLAESFANNWPDGKDLGLTVATGGMIFGILLGMALINWALNRGIISSVRTFNDRAPAEKIGVYDAEKRPSAGKQTVFSDSIDSLAWHIAMIGISILLGYAMLKGLQYLEVTVLPDCKTRLFNGFPLFPLCMIGGVIIQLLFQKFNAGHLIDHGQMQRLSGASLDFLVVAAVATIKLSVVAQNWLPLVIMMAAGVLWSVLLTLYVAPKLFKQAWFECAIAEFGQGLGVTATGLMLLRTVDPESKTVAAASFGYKQLIHEPVMGGGLWTAFALTLVFSIGWMPVWIFSTAMLLVWVAISLVVCVKNRR